MGYFDGLNLQLLAEPPAPPQKSGLLRRAVGDTAISAVKSAIGVPEMAVGLADIVSGGHAGKAAEEAGFRPKEAREALDSLYSPEQQAANREVQQAQGVWDTASAAIRNPSTIWHSVVESLPSMLPAGAAARGLIALKANPLLAIGAGEGLVSAGQTAEQIRQQTADGLLTGEQALLAAGSGTLTGLIGGVAGKIANKLGIGDVQQLVAGVKQAGPKAEKALTRALLEGFATEGILEELPQSAQEQIAQNVALGKPWDEGVANASVMGALAGGVMGVGGAGIGYRRGPHASDTPPPAGPPAPPDALTAGDAKADAAMNVLATTKDVGQMIDAAREIAGATPLAPPPPLGISAEQEAAVMTAGESLAQADQTDIKNMGRLDKTPTQALPAASLVAQGEQPAGIVPASEDGPAPFLDRLMAVTEALQQPEVRDRIRKRGGPDSLSTVLYYAQLADRPGGMDGMSDGTRERALQLAERVVFPKAAPPVNMPERRRTEGVPLDLNRTAPETTDPVLAYVDAKRAENTPAARMFVKEFEAGRITRRDVAQVMQTQAADPLATLPIAPPATDVVRQRLEQAAAKAQKPTGIQIETSRARPKGASDERSPERAVPGEGRAVDAGSQPRTAGLVQGELQQPGAAGVAGAPAPSAAQGVAAERAGRGLGDDALTTDQAVPVGGFDSEAWDKARSERIEASRNAGNVHLDKVPAYVETMRGKRIYYVHDEKVQGVIRTVDNRGNVYVDWVDSYSADKELASPVQEGRKTVFRSSIGARDLKDYALKSAKAPQGSAQAQAGTPAEGVGGSRPMPGQANQQERLRDARAIGRKASEEGKPRTPPPAFTTLEKQVWRAGWDEAKATKGAVPQVPAKPADQAAILPLDQAAHEAATSPQNDLPEPTDAQKEAGNYKVGRIKVAGFDISVENPAGSERSGIDPDGKKWRNTLAHHYGYIRRSEGADGDHVDVFVNPGTPEDYDGMVFVVDQADPKTGRWDEHKVMIGFPSAKAAQEAYQANYAKDWTGLRAVQPMTMEQFKAWVSDPASTKKPAAKGVKPGKGEKAERPDELVELRKRESALKSLRECLG